MRLLPDHALLQRLVAFLERLGAIPERLALAIPQRLVGGDRAAGHHFVVTVAVTVAVTTATTTETIAALDAGVKPLLRPR